MSSPANSPASETGARPRANALAISTPVSGSGSGADRPLGALPVQAMLTPALVDSLRRQASRWRGMDRREHKLAHADVDLFARAWREWEYEKLARWPTIPELAQLLDRLAVGLGLALPSSETLAAYFDELALVPTTLLQAGLSHLLRSYKYPRFPPIAEILSSVDAAAPELLRDLRAADAYCWKVELFLIDQLPPSVYQRELASWSNWRRSVRALSAVAGPFAPPLPESRTSSRSR